MSGPQRPMMPLRDRLAQAGQFALAHLEGFTREDFMAHANRSIDVAPYMLGVGEGPRPMQLLADGPVKLHREGRRYWLTWAASLIVDEFITALFTNGDLTAVDRYLDPGFVNHHPPFPGAPDGPEGMRTAGEIFRRAFPTGAATSSS